MTINHLRSHHLIIKRNFVLCNRPIRRQYRNISIIITKEHNGFLQRHINLLWRMNSAEVRRLQHPPCRPRVHVPRRSPKDIAHPRILRRNGHKAVVFTEGYRRHALDGVPVAQLFEEAPRIDLVYHGRVRVLDSDTEELAVVRECNTGEVVLVYFDGVLCGGGAVAVPFADD